RLQRFNSSEFGSRSTMMRSSSMVAPSSSNCSYIMSTAVPYSSYDESADPNTPKFSRLNPGCINHRKSLLHPEGHRLQPMCIRRSRWHHTLKALAHRSGHCQTLLQRFHNG